MKHTTKDVRTARLCDRTCIYSDSGLYSVTEYSRPCDHAVARTLAVHLE